MNMIVIIIVIVQCVICFNYSTENNTKNNRAPKTIYLVKLAIKTQYI